MNINLTENLIKKKTDSLLLVEVPFCFPDGDHYQIYIKIMSNGTIRVSDMGHTLMRLSYENDIKHIKEGIKGIRFNQIKTEMSIKDNNVELYIDSQINELAINILKLGQAITKIYDL